MNLSNHHLRLVLSPALLALGLSTAGCTATSAYMHEATSARPTEPTTGGATVVFVRPSGYAAGIKTTIFDERGGFLGDSLPESQFAATLPPGRHLFVAWAENTAALQADLTAGRTYYIEVAPRIGVFSARMHLLAITPRSKSWAKLPEWLRDSRPYEPDTSAGQAYLATRPDDVKERLRRAQEAIRKYDAEDLALHTLSPDDGR